jgi:hypothetical protein
MHAFMHMGNNHLEIWNHLKDLDMGNSSHLKIATIAHVQSQPHLLNDYNLASTYLASMAARLTRTKGDLSPRSVLRGTDDIHMYPSEYFMEMVHLS